MNPAHTLPALPTRRAGKLPLAELLWPVLVVGAVLILLLLSLRLPHPPQGLEMRRAHPAADPVVLLPGQRVAYIYPQQRPLGGSI
jgi:hypothetical protein